MDKIKALPLKVSCYWKAKLYHSVVKYTVKETTCPKSRSEVDVTKDQSSKWQKLGKVREKEVEEAINVSGRGNKKDLPSEKNVLPQSEYKHASPLQKLSAVQRHYIKSGLKIVEKVF